MGDPAADATPVGCVGRLVVATRGGDLPGEVRIAVRGGTELFLAYSVEPLPRGASVLVVAERSPREVDVEAWESTLVPGGPPA